VPRPVDKGTTYVPGLDGLRTLAVAAVILYHLNVSGVPGGLLGVGVFFTLSGYLITANLMRSRDRRGNFGLKTFWLRRFRRLAPAMIVTVIAVLILTTTLDRGAFTDRAGEALSTLFYVNNWHNILSEASYFDNFAGPGPLDHM
jgi:peptidoglycan/LPS O-acetylase OafA/YrhL